MTGRMDKFSLDQWLAWRVGFLRPFFNGLVYMLCVCPALEIFYAIPQYWMHRVIGTAGRQLNENEKAAVNDNELEKKASPCVPSVYRWRKPCGFLSDV